MTIVICASSKFFTDERLMDAKKKIESLNYTVYLPKNNDNPRSQQMRDHMRVIFEQAEAIFVGNYNHKGVNGYIGPNTYGEMMIAHYKQIPIFLNGEFSRDLPYTQEILAMNPVVVANNYQKIVDSLGIRH